MSPAPPPRYIPPHLQSQSANYSEAPSPSEAYAGLTINSDGASEMGGDRGDSLSHGAEGGKALGNVDSSLVHRQNSRSSSPAKRRASEMDGDHVQESVDRMDVDLVSGAVSGINGARTGRHHSNDISSTVSSSTTPSSLLGSSDVPLDGSSSSTQVDIDDDDTVPLLDVQVELVRAQAFESPQIEGMPGYAISMAWLARVISRSKYNVEMGPFDKSSLEGEIGPVDNSTILGTGEFTDFWL